ncbi:hypothetical protein VCRA2114E365_100106 [Vibrio crassostreae]|nr:hypothetical protein VCRA2114O369_100066 [Vibrio crassostreae]CAK1699447.1 hypothetical protein VCRA2113O356_100067 [Vibrio crassostreae]CAK1702796.1 hypothetical protein VCRA2113O362_100106 [Vibrio crassostreae]CAK1702871.1 hypothetical protein VCRA2114O367_100106 [Vibrio crassostreae]CAK1702964.1 hypothetical protein VCRA2113O363_100106 [Vibrio crassostreae]
MLVVTNTSKSNKKVNWLWEEQLKIPLTHNTQVHSVARFLATERFVYKKLNVR